MKKGFAASGRIGMPAGAFGLLLALVLVAVLVVPALAQIPPPPMYPYGAVTDEQSDPVAAGTAVYAVRDGVVVGVGTVDVSGGTYGKEALYEIAGEAADTGKVVMFYVGGSPSIGQTPAQAGGQLTTTDPTPILWASGNPGYDIDLMLGEAPAQNTLVTASTAGGNVTDPGEGNNSHVPGTVVPLVATPDEGFCFVNWTGDTGQIADVNAATTTITMNGHYTVTANFVAKVTLVTGSGAGGSVTGPGEGTFLYCPGAVVPLVATPEAGFVFNYWEGNNGTVADINAASTTITMDATYTVTARFTEVGTADLTLSSSAGGTVTTPAEAGSPYSYNVGTVVPLVATPDGGFVFVNWTGGVGTVADTNAAGTTITMDADYAIQANFEETAAPTYTLTVSSGTMGSVTQPGEGVFTYDEGTVVALVAAPEAGRAFNFWTGNVANTLLASTTITMNQNEAVSANFRTSGGGGGGGGGGGVPPTATPTPSPTPGPTSEPTSTPTPSPTPVATPPTFPTDETIDLSGSIDDDGVVQGEVSHTGFSGTMGVSIGSGTTAQTEGGDPLPEITITEMCFGYPPPPANAYVVGCAYDFGPDGATFDPPITITLEYDDGNLPAGVAEEDLVIAIYDESAGVWVVLPSTVDTVNNVITAEASHFTYFAVYAAAPAPTGTPGPTSEPTATPTPTPEPDEGGSNVGLIVGLIIGAIIVILIIVVVLRRRGASE